MKLDPANRIVSLCTKGMALEAKGAYKDAFTVFEKAWLLASDNFEKFIAAHYLARVQNGVEKKLEWDRRALLLARKVRNAQVRSSYPSLYLNIGKCYEDLNNFKEAQKHYQRALYFCKYLPPESSYSKLTINGVNHALERMKTYQPVL